MNEENDDILGGEDAAPAKKKKTKKTPDAKKPSKAKVTKPAAKATAEDKPAKKGATKKAAPAPAAKSKKAAKEEDAPKRGRPKVRDDDVSTQQPEDSVVLKAVRKLKEATLAAEFAAGLGVHRRVIRAQLQRLSKDKANGVKMEKDGYNWFVSNKQKAA